ncbi:hypothetical protein LSH36_768g00022 [Paralvinella palmiformis]|uniref:Uncharacterized protein n=1 Tax=Paralvinella palmiformis TaxID=53620 RepID=A0AAD9J1N4_9ANNE|nr:hypothetical protein LSH36_768g00022 [Paralvinella palmiformis]
MTAPGTKRDNNKAPDLRRGEPPIGEFWLHIKVLYGLWLVLFVAGSLTSWQCLERISRLRADFEGEILPSGVVEFAEPRRYRGNGEWDVIAGEQDGEGDDDDNVTSYADRPIGVERSEDEATPDGSPTGRDSYEVFEGQGEGHEELIRVKRKAPDSSRRRKRKRDKPRENGHYFYGDNPPMNQDGSEGSGVGSMDDWVWLTSYSRIPVSTDDVMPVIVTGVLIW